MPSLNFVLSYSKQLYFIAVFKRSSSFKVSSGHIKLVKDFSGCSEEDVIKCLSKMSTINNLSHEELDHRLQKLKEYKLEDANLLERVALVTHHPKTIKNRYLVFKELGAPDHSINSNTIHRYVKNIKTKISVLKKRNILEKNTNVMENLLKCLPLDPALVDRKFDDSSTIQEIKSHILRHFLTKVIGFPEPLNESKVMLKRIKNKSLTEIVRNLDLLQNNLRIPLEKIRNNPFLLSASDADNTLDIIKSFPVVAGVDVATIMNNHPKILASSFSNFSKIHTCLKEAGISDEALSKCFEVFTLNNETVKFRLERCHKHKFLSVCRHHPRILELVLYHNKALKRLDKLDSTNCDFVTLNLLSNAESLFEKFYEMGSERYHGMEAVYFLAEELGADRDLVKSRLQTHPFWNYASIFNISSNLGTLRSKGFTNDEILREISILFYPETLVAKGLDKLDSRENISVCKDENGELKRHCILPLVLYFIERESGFEGKAVWFKDSSPAEKLLANSKMDGHFLEIDAPSSRPRKHTGML